MSTQVSKPEAHISNVAQARTDGQPQLQSQAQVQAQVQGQVKAQSPTPWPVPVPALATTGRAYRGQTRAPWVDLILDGNEGTGPEAHVLQSLQEEFPDVLRRYPDAGRLEAAIARRLHLPAHVEVLVTAGADDALERAVSAYLDEGRNLVHTIPTFEMVDRYAKLTGCQIRTVPWLDGPYPLDGVLELIDCKTGVIVVISPNNPTGNTVDPGVLRALAEKAPQALLVVDLAYTEFADEDLTPSTLELPGAVVLRTFSKAWGLAGLRVGYALGAPAVIDVLRRAGQPYPVSRPSLAIAEWCLDGGGAGRGAGHGGSGNVGSGSSSAPAYVAAARVEREALVREIQTMGGTPMPSQANFILAQFKNSEFVHAGLMALGVSVRSFTGKPLLDHYLRITLPGNKEHMATLINSFRTVLAPQAILFDMDGVLADVSRSYRQAIRETAARFGVECDYARIAAAKLEPDSNNDWKVCQRLLAKAGVDVSIEQVTQVFEGVYSGAAGEQSEGLWRLETMIPQRSVLEKLASRFVLGIVTGRPRRDAERFLTMVKLDGLFDTMVCMEDAPCKPDPAPVRLAMEKLGVKHGWLVGDSPDDMTAARLAGVLPVGFINDSKPPWESENLRGASNCCSGVSVEVGLHFAAGTGVIEPASALSGAGASTVLSRIEQLELLLP